MQFYRYVFSVLPIFIARILSVNAYPQTLDMIDQMTIEDGVLTPKCLKNLAEIYN